MIDYNKLTNNQRLALCKRYGHKKVLDRTDNHCARCTHRWPHAGSDTMMAYFEQSALKRLAEHPKILNAYKNIKTKGKTMTFNSWKPLNEIQA